MFEHYHYAYLIGDLLIGIRRILLDGGWPLGISFLVFSPEQLPVSYMNGYLAKDLRRGTITTSGVLFLVLVHNGLNSMCASSIALIVIAGTIVIFRKDLFWDAVLSSLLFGLLCAVGYKILFSIYPGILEAWWLSAHASGRLVVGIPVEELLFQFSLGMAMGPAYEFLVGAKFKK